MDTKFMTRIFSAMENKESELLDQVDNDINVALEDGSCKADGQYSMDKIDEKTVKIHDDVNDEDTIAEVNDSEVKLSNLMDKKIQEIMTACNTKSFASTFKDGKFIFSIDGLDFAIDLKNNVIYNIDDERQHWEFKSTDKFIDLLNKIEKEVKGSPKTRKFTAKHIAEHKNNVKLRNADDLDPEVRKKAEEEYEDRFNKCRTFTAKKVK